MQDLLELGFLDYLVVSEDFLVHLTETLGGSPACRTVRTPWMTLGHALDVTGVELQRLAPCPECRGRAASVRGIQIALPVDNATDA